LVLNLIYAAIRTFVSPRPFTVRWEGLGLAVLMMMQYTAYKGILEHAASGTTASAKSSKSSELTGGKSLDVLGLALLLQYASILSLRFIYWGIWVFPIWGVYQLYSTFKK
jgi:hypothetical protein